MHRSLCVLITTLLCTLAVAWVPAAAQPERRQTDRPLRVSLLPGDGQSAAATSAVKQLMKHRELAGIRFQIYPDNGLDEADRRFLATSDLIVISSFSRTLAPTIGDDRQTHFSATSMSLSGRQSHRRNASRM